MFTKVRDELRAQLEEIRSEGLFKPERVIVTPQQATVKVSDGREVLNLCANNYLGLADDPRVIAAAKQALDRWGYGMASVRFICGTQEVHKDLERRLSGFLGTEDSILYSSCFDANGGLFETLLGEEDAVISDELNHASIIDGIRLCCRAPLPLPQPGHGAPRGATATGLRRAAPADSDRRGVLDGRLRLAPAGDLRAGRSL